MDEALLYLDSSALVKLVVAEDETDALTDWLGHQAGACVTSAVSLVEVVRAVRVATGGDPDANDDALRTVRSCALVALAGDVLERAHAAAGTELRTLDALHLASAMSVGADLVVSYDRRLSSAATVAGLAVQAPR